MSEKHMSNEEKQNILRKSRSEATEEVAHSGGDEKSTLTTFQQQVGNRAVQRLLAQRSSEANSGGFELDDETSEHINRERGSGQALDGNVQTKMNEATGQDFEDVRVHTGPESHALNEQLSAKAFTTGSDIFFRDGAYDPNSSGGQELLAHELTHVVQQRSGSVGDGSGRMSVNAPGDTYEQEADSVAKSMSSGGAAPAVQRQMPEDELQEKRLQRQELEKEEEEQTTALQREDVPEEEQEEDLG